MQRMRLRLAGASGLNFRASGITEATNRAVELPNFYEFNRKRAKISQEQVRFAINLDGPYMSQAEAQPVARNIRFVQVTTSESPVEIYFASMVLGISRNLTAKATAGLSVPFNVFCDWIPLSVIDEETRVITPGNMYTIRAPSAQGSSPLGGGNYQILKAPGSGGGGSETRKYIAEGIKPCLSPGDQVWTDTGIHGGPVRDGINTRFGIYGGGNVNPVDHPPDTNVAEQITYAQYRAGAPFIAPTNAGVQGRRIVIIPIIKKTEFPPDSGGGSKLVRIDRFGAFFLRASLDNGGGSVDVQAEYIGDPIALGSFKFDPHGLPGEPEMATPVLYK